jgi:hypothetical protein
MDTFIAKRLNEKHAERKLALGEFLQLKAKVLNMQRQAKDAVEIQDSPEKVIA